MEFKKLALGVAVSSALLLSACGGDSDGSSTPAPTSTTISGTAAKGIIKGGIVTAYELVAGEWKQVGTTTTDDKGQYSLTLTGYQGGPLKISITADANTQMKCDVDTCAGGSFGDFVDVNEAAFELDAVLPKVEEGTSLSNVPVTPYTHMAAARVEEQLKADPSQVDADLVSEALVAISQLVNFDVASTRVLDITDAAAMASASAIEQSAAAKGAALLTLAESTPLETLLDELANSFADGSFTSEDAFQLSELVTAWEAVQELPQIADKLNAAAKDELAVTILSVKDEITDEEYTPPSGSGDDQSGGSSGEGPGGSTDDSDVAKAKELVSGTRSFIANIIETDFDSPLDALGLDVEETAEVFNRDSAAMSEILGLGVEQLIDTLYHDETIQNEFETLDTVTRQVTIKSGEQSLGTLTLVISNQAAIKATLKGTLTGTGDNPRTVAVDLAFDSNLDWNQVDDVNETTAQTALGLSLSGSVGDDSTRLTLRSGTVSASLSGAMVRNEQGEDNLQEVLTGLKLENLDAQLKSGKATFDGQAAANFVRLDSGKVFSSYHYRNKPLLNLKKVELAGAFTTDLGKKVAATLGVDLANADTFDLVAFMSRDEVVWISENDAIPDETIQALKAASNLADAASWGVNYARASTPQYYPTYEDWVNQQPVSQYAHSWGNVTKECSYYDSYSQQSMTYDCSEYQQYDDEDYASFAAIFDPVAEIEKLAPIPGGEVLSASVYVGGWTYEGVAESYSGLWGQVRLPEYSESADNFMQLKVSASLGLSGIEGLPEARAAVVVDRNQFKGGNATLLVKWDGEQYTFRLEGVDVEQQTGALTVTSPVGVSLQLKELSIADKSGSGALYVGNTKVADVKTLDSGAIKISYIDGTFETLQ